MNLAPDAVLCLPAGKTDAGRAGDVLFFFKNRQFACWDVAGDAMLASYPQDIAREWPGVLESFPDARLRGALHVPEWGNRIHFLFENVPTVVVWDRQRRAVESATTSLRELLPTALPGTDMTALSARLADGKRVIYAFEGFDYTRWTVGESPPAAEDRGFPRRIAEDWKDGLVLAPRAGVYVDWPNRSSAHSNSKIYFFMGNLYLRWDVTSNSRNYRLDIPAGWKNWPAFA